MPLFAKGKKKIGLALSGGAARGLAHIGVLKVLEEEEIPVDYVAGTSVGGLVGAVHCAGHSWQEIKRIASRINWGDLISPILPIMGLVRPEKLEKALDRVISEKKFEELKIPFKTVAVDISTGEEMVLKSGSVARAVRASCSIPGIFEPTKWGDRLLVDGGLVNNVPADVVRDMGADLVIAVDLNGELMYDNKAENILDIIYSSFSIVIRNSTQRGRESADFLIAPDLKGFSYHNLKKLDELMRRGEQAIREQVERIKKAL